MESTNSRPIDRALRIVAVFSWFPAVAFLIPHGVNSETLVPVLGLIPMTFSALTGLVHLYKRANLKGANVVVDIFTASFLIAILIPGWINLANGSRHYWGPVSAGVTMVGTYGTVCMITNFVIHTYFALRNIKDLRSGFFAPHTCPHCHGDLTPEARRHAGQDYHGLPTAETPTSHDSKESFVPITMTHEEPRPSSSKEPRPSTDDEAARLV